jgi:hypothetical protein
MVSFSFIISSTGILFLNEYLRNKYPKQYQDTMIMLYFNAIFLYTQFQIVSVKGYKKLITDYPIINDKIQKIYEIINSFIPKTPFYVCEFVKNGDVILGFTEEQINTPDFKMPDENLYDFFVFSDYEKIKDGCVQKIVHRSVPGLTFASTPSSVRFILSEITIGIDAGLDKTIKISFSTEKYNYLMKNNIIDKQFMKYFMRKHYYQEIADNDRYLLQNYKMKIIDNDVKISIFDNSSQIVILENGYMNVSQNESIAKNNVIDEPNLAETQKFQVSGELIFNSDTAYEKTSDDFVNIPDVE